MPRLLALTSLFLSPTRTLRRPRLWATLLPVALAVSWSVGSLGQPTSMMPLSQASWQTHQAEGITFSLPDHWSVTESDDGSLRLAEAATPDGPAITVTFAPEAPKTLGDIERYGVLLVERDPAITRHFLRIGQRARIAGRAAVRLQYTADFAAGHRIDATWMALPLDDGRLLGFTLTVPTNAYHTAANALFRRFVQSVSLVP